MTLLCACSVDVLRRFAETAIYKTNKHSSVAEHCRIPRKAAAEHAGHAEHSAEHAFSRTRVQQPLGWEIGRNNNNSNNNNDNSSNNNNNDDNNSNNKGDWAYQPVWCAPPSSRTPRAPPLRLGPAAAAAARRGSLGTKDCTPEIDTSELIVDFQLHFPMDVQWRCPTDVHLSVVFSEGLPLSQWMFTGNVQRTSTLTSNGISLL